MGTATRTRAMARAWYHSRGGRGRLRAPRRARGTMPSFHATRAGRGRPDAVRGLRGGCGTLGYGLAQELVDALDQFPRAERLRDVGVRAHIEPQLLIDVPALRGEEDHRDV